MTDRDRDRADDRGRERPPGAGEPPPSEPGERVGDSLRGAVERTLAATAGSASETRQRARELLDEVARRGEAAREELGRRGDAAREQLGRRGEAARDQVVRTRDAAREDLARRGEEAGSRLAEAIADLRPGERPQPGAARPIVARLEAIEMRLGRLERLVGVEVDESLENRESQGQAKAQVEGESEVGPSSGGADSGG